MSNPPSTEPWPRPKLEVGPPEITHECTTNRAERGDGGDTEARPGVLCSWGQYDGNQFTSDCRQHGQQVPVTFRRHINLKQMFATQRGIRPALINVTYPEAPYYRLDR